MWEKIEMGNKMNFSKVYNGNSVGIMSIDRK
jgi:hypothetical protein